ncbi:hypothetical protein GMI70_02910 [Eggerthellaceae bacterium zg-893]|nr:hypothetical protein [Eggerthellaceae bacterium zg-893]
MLTETFEGPMERIPDKAAAKRHRRERRVESRRGAAVLSEVDAMHEAFEELAKRIGELEAEVSFLKAASRR